MPLEIRAIDLHEVTALRAWWEVGRAATAERPGNPFPAWEVSRTALPADIAPDGSVAGSSDVRINDADPSHGQVGVTIVDSAHRGHRLDQALATYPECASVDTWNAEVNAHMNAVNDALGYRSIETVLELQKKL